MLKVKDRWVKQGDVPRLVKVINRYVKMHAPNQSLYALESGYMADDFIKQMITLKLHLRLNNFLCK